MKKIFAVLMTFVLCSVIVLSNPFKVNAAGASMSASGAASVAEGQTVVITFQVKGVSITSGSIELSCSDDLEIVSGKWLLSGTMMADFGGVKGVAAFTKATAVNGNYFQVTLRGKNISKTASVTATAILKNGSTELGTVSVTKKVAVICKNHSFGDWTTVEPSCTKAGYKTRTCSVCDTVDRQTLAALGHDVTNATITKAPTCTDAGVETGTCARCGESVTQAVKAKGHDYGPWIVTTASTCAQHGEETRTCKTCNHQEHQEAELLDHDFGGTEEVLREATISVPGLVCGTCVNCGLYAEQETPCAMHDHTSGIEISAEEGTFLPGTEVQIQEMTPEEVTEAITEKIQQMSQKYVIYNVSALLDGATVQPNGDVTIVFPLAEGFSKNVAVVYFDDEGNFEMVASKVRDDGTIEATLKHFSCYAVYEIEMIQPVTPDNGTSGIFFYVAIGEGVLILLLFILLLAKGKKKQ